MQSKAKSLLDTQIKTRFGKLKLETVIGQGSFAVVYSSGKQFAIKVLFKETLNENQLQRDEVLISGLVAHDNVASLKDFVETDDCVFLVFDLFHSDLFDALVDCKLLISHFTALELFLDLLNAVSFAHSIHVYHQDIKPENVLINNFTCPKLFLADWGLATRNSWSYDYGVGSIRYMSPECLNQENSTTGYDTAANDVFSLGVIFVNLLSNKNPWSEPCTSDPMYQDYLKNKHTFFQTYFGVDDDINKILQGCLDPNPYTRWKLPRITKIIKSLIAYHKQDDLLFAIDEMDQEMDFSVEPQFNDLFTPIKRIENSVPHSAFSFESCDSMESRRDFVGDLEIKREEIVVKKDKSLLVNGINDLVNGMRLF